MEWYNDLNLIIGLLINAILLAVGLLRRGVLYPLVGILITSIMYEQYPNYWLMFLGFMAGHLVALIHAIRGKI